MRSTRRMHVLVPASSLYNRLSKQVLSLPWRGELVACRNFFLPFQFAARCSAYNLHTLSSTYLLHESTMFSLQLRDYRAFQKFDCTHERTLYNKKETRMKKRWERCHLCYENSYCIISFYNEKKDNNWRISLHFSILLIINKNFRSTNPVDKSIAVFLAVQLQSPLLDRASKRRWQGWKNGY